jgi:hypothetical protein
MEGRKLSQALKNYCYVQRGLGTYDAIGLTQSQFILMLQYHTPYLS